MTSKYSISFILFYFLLFNIGFSQESFNCDGSSYLIVGDELYTLSYEENQGIIQLFELPLRSDDDFAYLDAIGYRPTDDFIYGIGEHVTFQSLIRIDATGNVIILDTLQFSTLNFASDYLYVTGTVSPDGSHLVILEKPKIPENTPRSNLIKINLETFDVKMIETSTTGSVPYIFCADIDYDPISHILYGFDLVTKRMVTIDDETGLIDNSNFPIQTHIDDTLPGLFFNPKGEFKGLDIKNNKLRLLNINKQSGQISVLPTENAFQSFAGIDACSCPYTIEIKKTVHPRETIACSKVNYTFEIANLHPVLQDSVRFYDAFPETFEDIRIVRNPFGGQVDITENKVDITNMTIPRGVDSIIIEAYVPSDAAGAYFNQAQLSEVKSIGQAENRQTFRSDDPDTAMPFDSTRLFVIAPETLSLADTIKLCEDQSLTIPIPEIFSNVTAYWEGAPNLKTLTVDTPGEHLLTVVSICDTLHIFHEIVPSELDIILNVDDPYQLTLGDSIFIEPTINSFSPIDSYLWKSSAADSYINCDTCQNLTAFSPQDTRLFFQVTNKENCTASENVQVIIETNVYAATVFQPTANDMNNTFFLQTKEDLPIEEIHVFDRWGNEVYLQKDIRTNDPQVGWKGDFKQQTCPSGVYTWWAKITYSEHLQIIQKGEITLVK